MSFAEYSHNNQGLIMMIYHRWLHMIITQNLLDSWVLESFLVFLYNNHRIFVYLAVKEVPK